MKNILVVAFVDVDTWSNHINYHCNVFLAFSLSFFKLHRSMILNTPKKRKKKHMEFKLCLEFMTKVTKLLTKVGGGKNEDEEEQKINWIIKQS